MKIKNSKGRIPAFKAIFLIIVIGAFAFFFSSCGKNQENGPEVISKRVKLTDSGDEQQKPDLKPAAGNMPDVKADLPVKEAVKNKSERPTIKVEISEKKEPEVLKEKAKPGLAVKENNKKEAQVPKKPEKIQKAEILENNKTSKASKTVSKKPALNRNAMVLKRWAVNVASFPNENEAKKLVNSLKSAGYNGYITEFMKNDIRWHRVRVGFYRSREEAQKAGKRISAKFKISSSWVVKPAKKEAQEHIN